MSKQKEIDSANEYIFNRGGISPHVPKRFTRDDVCKLAEQYADYVFLSRINEVTDKENSFYNTLFSAYLTGQTDVRSRASGEEGRSFSDWYKDNVGSFKEWL